MFNTSKLKYKMIILSKLANSDEKKLINLITLEVFELSTTLDNI